MQSVNILFLLILMICFHQYLEILVRFAEKADLGIIGYTSQIDNSETDTNVRHVLRIL